MMLATSALFVVAWSPAPAAVPSLWPQPTSATSKGTSLTVTPSTTFFTLEGTAKSPFLTAAFERESAGNQLLPRRSFTAISLSS